MISKVRLDEKLTKKAEAIIGFASFSFFLILVFSLYVIDHNILGKLVAFVGDFKFVEAASNVWLPAPASNHPEIYRVVELFCFAFGLFETIVLVSRFILGSSQRKKADTASRMIFWFGTGFFTLMLLTEIMTWFNFLSGLVILIIFYIGSDYIISIVTSFRSERDS